MKQNEKKNKSIWLQSNCTAPLEVYVWNESSPALIQLDVYTCGPFDPNAVIEHIQVWEPTKVDYKYLDRESGLTEIEIQWGYPLSFYYTFALQHLFLENNYSR